MSLKKGLGKGLNVLIPENDMADDYTEKEITSLKITEIEPNRGQPRRTFEETALKELADSIAIYGILQPILVRKNEGYYEIVAGERRWRAARLAGLREVPVIIKDYDNLKALEVALIENLQRENLNPMEEALTYKKLQDNFGLTQEAIAEKVGKKRSTIANSLRMLNLPEKVQEMLENNAISMGHAKALLAVDDEDIQNTVAEKIAENDFTVRQVEALMKKLAVEKAKKKKQPMTTATNLIYYRSVESQMNSLLGTKVKLLNGKKRGKIEIEYFSDDDLNRLLELFKKLEEV